MSYHIEYQHEAVRVPATLLQRFTFENGDYIHGDMYLFVTLSGDNNLISHYDNRPARRWSAIAFDQLYCCMQEIAKRSAACESGCLKPLGRDTKPENYIRKWRDVAADASVYMPGHGFANFGVTLTLHLRHDEVAKFGRWQRERLESLMKYRAPQASKPFLADGADSDWMAFTFQASVPEDIACYLAYRNVGGVQPCFQQVKVTGPGCN